MATHTKLAVTASEACEIVGLGRSKILELTYTGEIRSFKIGSARRYLVADLEAWLHQQVDKLDPPLQA